MLVIYGTPTCPFCDRAKELAERVGMEYEYVDVTEREDAQALFKSRGFRTVPQVYHQNSSGKFHHVGGFTELSRDIEILSAED